MSIRFFFFSLCLTAFFSSGVCVAQTPIFKNYGVKDGLAGSTVYHVIQDRQGFMWFGTDQGLCRFDGTNFKTYTTVDGLPDNEVLRMAEDSLGRLWMMCYNSRPSFLYRGIVHNSENDTLLQSIEAKGSLFRNIIVDREGRIWLVGLKVYVVDKNRVLKFDLPQEESENAPSSIGYIGEQLSMITYRSVYKIEIDNDLISYDVMAKGVLHTPYNSPAFAGKTCYIIESLGSEKAAVIKVSEDTAFAVDLYPLGIKDVVVSHSIYNSIDSTLLISTGKHGIKALDQNLNLLPEPYPFLSGDVTYSHTTFDRDGNTWIASLGRGVFFIPADKTLRYTLSNKFPSSNATSVYQGNSKDILIGFDYSGYAILKDGKLTGHVLKNSLTARNRVIRQCNFNDHTVLLGTDMGIYAINEADPAHPVQIVSAVVKNLVSEGKDSVLVGGTGNLCRLTKTQTGFRLDSLWNERTTAIAKDKDGKIWLGGLNGLFVYDKGIVNRFAQNSLINKSRITDLLCDEHDNIWVATHQRGLFVITRDSVVAINARNGLSEDVCIRLFQESNGVMWVCNNRHLAKITYHNSEGFSFNVTSLGELSGNEEVSVNDVFVDSLNIWIATTSGLLQMKKANQKAMMPPPIYITSFQSSDSVFTDFNPLQLKYFQNNIQIDYVGISYNSGGKIAYKYLLGSDTVFTRNTSLNFNSLSPGIYTFHVWAKNIAGLWSATPATLTFQIFPPFWKTWWFRSFVLLITALVIWAMVRWRIHQIRTREKEKTSINKKIAEVELQAIRAQMNEHFIFNSLNSIQNFINQNNVEAANFYLANFGKLIRRTLDVSSMPVISLKEEMDYLENYLTLEKMRFGEKFDYFLTNNITGVAAEVIIFPSMILQPYTENAIRHGLRYKNSGRGVLTISFTRENDFVVCRIDDNGIGRAEAKRLKENRLSHHESKGVKLSEDRVDLFNRAHDHKIKVEFEDKINESGRAAGTLVKVFVPFNTDV